MGINVLFDKSYAVLKYKCLNKFYKKYGDQISNKTETL